MTRHKLALSLRSGVLGPILVFLAALAVFAPTANLSGIHVDVASSALGGFRIATHGSPWLDGVDVDDFPITFGIPLWVGEADNGHTVVMRSPGAVAAAVPGYWVTDPGPGLDEFEIAPQALTAALLAALTLMLVFVALRPLGGQHAGLVVLVLGLATPMWSVDADQLWTHTITTLGIAGMAYSASRERWWLLGLFGGIGLWGRLHVALIVAILGVGLAVWRRKPAIAVKVGLASGALLTLAVAWGHWMYGGWSPSGGYAAGAIASAATSAGGNGSGVGFVNQLGLWFSLDRGILVWTPVLVVLLPALIRSWSAQPDWTRTMLLAGAVYTLIQGRLNPFHGGDGHWGYRLGLEFLLCATPAFAYAARSLVPWERRVLPPVLGIQFAAISIGALTEAVYLTTDQMWDHNSFVEALRARPGTWVWLALSVCVGLAWSGRSARRGSGGPHVEAGSAR